MEIKRQNQRAVFISHNSQHPFPIAYAAGRFCFPPAFPLPPIVIERKVRRVEVAA